MRSRRALLWLLAAVVVGLGALSAARRDDERRATSPPPQTTTGALPRASAPAGRQVRGELPADRVVTARPGDFVVLRVRSDVPDVARVAGLGVQGAVGPGIPGELGFQALEPARHPVVLQVSGRRVGTVEVRAAAGD
jgi:hypothetical protein